MSAQLDLIEAEISKLPLADRAHLLERLVASLDSDPEMGVTRFSTGAVHESVT